MRKMHADERNIDLPLVARLIARQFPQWSDLSLLPVRSTGTDNGIYRLGDDMAVQLPRITRAVGDVGARAGLGPLHRAHRPAVLPGHQPGVRRNRSPDDR